MPVNELQFVPGLPQDPKGLNRVVKDAPVWEWLRMAVGGHAEAQLSSTSTAPPTPQTFWASVGGTTSQYQSNEHLVSLRWKKHPLLLLKSMMLNPFNDWTNFSQS